jgi:hypothetical protein
MFRPSYTDAIHYVAKQFAHETPVRIVDIQHDDICVDIIFKFPGSDALNIYAVWYEPGAGLYGECTGLVG